MDRLVNKNRFLNNIVKNIRVKIFSWVPLTHEINLIEN